jgi:hypothetical protein
VVGGGGTCDGLLIFLVGEMDLGGVGVNEDQFR